MRGLRAGRPRSQQIGMPMPVSVARRCPAGVRIPDLIRTARLLLHALGETHAELTVSLVDDAEMQQLNRNFRGKDRPTDVLAFAMREGARAPGDDAMLGDVVISVDTAARQARRRRVPIADEVRALLIHGVLHLLGYDHQRPAEARVMRARERALRTRLEDPNSRSPRHRRSDPTGSGPAEGTPAAGPPCLPRRAQRR
jgi:probable rRNA maturation factor